MSIAIAISTFNRAEVYENTYSAIKSLSPTGTPIFTVEDAHTESDSYRISNGYKFEQRTGIPAVKNKCLELLMETEAEHLFLFDDDCYPISPEWHEHYAESAHKLLHRTFYKPSGFLKDGHPYFNHTANGCMIYVHRSIIETIGGFDTAFGLGKYEHNQFGQRAYHVGLIEHPYIDVPNSNELLYCLDEKAEIKRTLSDREQKELVSAGASHYFKTYNQQNLYINYK